MEWGILISMLKLLIVDDEDVIREGLCSVVDWEQLGFHVGGTAANGEKALQFMEQCYIDVVLADIRMPKLSGIELAQEIQHRYPHVKVIILSGYDSFEYARNAIRYNVFSYLLKPCREEDIVDVFTRLKNAIDTQRKHEQLVSDAADALIIEEMRALGSGCGPYFPRLTEWVEVKQNAYIYILSIYPKPPFLYDCEDDWDTVLYRLQTEYLNETKDNDILFCSLNGNNRYIVLSEQPPEEIEIKLNSYLGNCGYFSGTVVQLTDDEWRSHIKLLLENLHLRVASDERIIQIDFMSTINEGIEHKDELKKANTGYDDALARFECDAALQSLSRYIEELKSSKTSSLEPLIKYIEAGFISARESCVEGYTIFDEVYGTIGDLILAIRGVVRLEEAREILTYWMEQASQKRDCTNNPSSRIVIQRAMSYITHNYDQDFSLDDLAEHLCLTPSYVSRLFKMEIGRNFKEYLTQYRIEKAKKLLLSSTMKVYEIADQVGFKEQHYFSNVFKKNQGCSPQQYRNFFRDKAE